MIRQASIPIVIVLLLINFACAFGATPPYWKDRPLIMVPGETKEVPIILQNMVGGKDLTLRAEIINGSEIATLENQNYPVPFGRNDIKANLKIKIPNNTKVNDKYQLTILFEQVSQDEGKMLQLSTGITASFPVIISGEEIKQKPVEEKQPSEISESPKSTAKIFSTIIISIIAMIIIILIFIISLLIKNHKYREYAI